jgi:probable HAF family extracellular repeat protein
MAIETFGTKQALSTCTWCYGLNPMNRSNSLILMAVLSLIMSAAAQSTNSALSPVSPQAQSQNYTITDIGTNSFASAINRLGQIVGFSPVAPSVGNPYPSTRAFIDFNGQTQTLGTLGGALSLASGINDHGQVVGSSTTVASNSFHAFIWTAGLMQDLGTLGGTTSNGNAINNRGVVVGGSTLSTGNSRAIIYIGGRMLDMKLGDESVALGVNDFNQVVGLYRTNTILRPQRAFLWQNGVVHLLPSLGGDNAAAYAINNLGHVVGWSAIVNDLGNHAFLYADNKIKDVGTLNGDAAFSYAYAINERDEVVGYSADYSVVGVPYSAFLYKSGVMVNLNKFAKGGWVLQQAWGINNDGQIVGTGTYNGDPQHAFLMTPVR